MTAVIGWVAGHGYRRTVAVSDDVQRIARALARPRAGYLDRLERTRRAVAPRVGEAARQLEVFADRIAGLTLDELRELHDETFRRAGSAGIGREVRRVAQSPAGLNEAGAALDAAATLLARLEADRNPFASVVKALCCVLLVRAGQRD